MAKDATQSAVGFLEGKEDLKHNEFLQAYGRADMKRLSSVHAKLRSSLENLQGMLRDAGLLEAEWTDVVHPVTKVLDRGGVMNLKWAAITMLAKDATDPGSQKDKIEELLTNYFTDDVKACFPADVLEELLGKTTSRPTEPPEAAAAQPRKRTKKQ